MKTSSEGDELRHMSNGHHESNLLDVSPEGTDMGTASVNSFAICTIIAHNYLHMARILARSVAQFHPEATMYVVVVDWPVETRLVESGDFVIIPITDIDFSPSRYQTMAAIYDVTEFATAVKPFALKHLLGTHDCVFYLDPDIELFDRLDPLLAKTREIGWSLTPHCVAPIPRDGAWPSEHDIMQSGVYNLGFVGVSKEAMPFLEWWSTRLLRDSIIDPSRHLFTDQRWIDMAVPLFPHHIETGPEYNVAYWNVDQRRLWCADGKYMVEDQPLRFYHFSGYDPSKPDRISKHYAARQRIDFAWHPVLRRLFDEYGAKVEAERALDPSRLPYGWSYVIPGIPLFTGLRRLYRSAVIDAEELGEPVPPSPFDDEGPAPFLAWLTEVAPGEIALAPRYHVAFLAESGYVVGGRWSSSVFFRLGWLVLWQVKYKKRNFAERLLANFGRHLTKRSRTEICGNCPTGVDVYGYFRGAFGVAQAGRLATESLLGAGCHVTTTAISGHDSHRSGIGGIAQNCRHDTALLCVNADSVNEEKARFRKSEFKNRYIIGQWFWEIGEFPATLMDAFSEVDEIWAPSRFICETLGKAAPPSTKVLHMPLPLALDEPITVSSRVHFGFEDEYVFLFMFDMLSVFDRKNPLGLVAAFQEAFNSGQKVRLVIKTMNGRTNQEALMRLQTVCNPDPRIVLVDKRFGRIEATRLISVADCYVSLHRSEGLGLSMAEAMSLGKPVIATGYSGNLDFMNEENSFLVPWTDCRIGEDSAPYPEGALWADPDLSIAAEFMRQVVSDPQQGRDIGLKGQSDIKEQFSRSVTGARMRERLEAISFERGTLK